MAHGTVAEPGHSRRGLADLAAFGLLVRPCPVTRRRSPHQPSRLSAGLHAPASGTTHPHGPLFRLAPELPLHRAVHSLALPNPHPGRSAQHRAVRIYSPVDSDIYPVFA